MKRKKNEVLTFELSREDAEEYCRKSYREALINVEMQTSYATTDLRMNPKDLRAQREYLQNMRETLDKAEEFLAYISQLKVEKVRKARLW